MSVDINVKEGQSLRTKSDRVEVVNDETGEVITYVERRSGVEVRVDGVRVPAPGEVETR